MNSCALSDIVHDSLYDISSRDKLMLRCRNARPTRADRTLSILYPPIVGPRSTSYRISVDLLSHAKLRLNLLLILWRTLSF